MFANLSPWWIGAVVAVCGWFVVQKFNDRRETRKEVRRGITEVTRLIEEVQAECYQYYIKAGSDDSIRPIGQDIRCKLKQIGTRVAGLNQDLPNFALGTRSVRFRQAASSLLDDFSRAALPIGSPVYEDISNSGSTLVSALEQAFSSRYK
jgi:hypothetical protein